MKLEIPAQIIADAKKVGVKNPNIIDLEVYGWTPSKGEKDTRVAHAESNLMSMDELKKLLKLTDTSMVVKPSEELFVLQATLKQLIKLADGKKVIKLDVLAEAMALLMTKTEHYWAFISQKPYKQLSPVLVTTIEFHEGHHSRDNYWIPATIDVEAVGLVRGKQINISKSIHRADYPKDGITPQEAFAFMDLFPETPDLFAAYQNSMARYDGIRIDTGLQLLIEGMGRSTPDIDDEDIDEDTAWCWWKDDSKIVLVSGYDGPDRGIVDDAGGWKEDATSERVQWLSGRVKFDVSTKAGRARQKEIAEESVSDSSRPIPAWPVIRAFDLRLHEFVLVHVEQVKRYTYNADIFDKLVIDPDIKSVIDMLVIGDDGTGHDDIIIGKGKGAIVLAYGPPGTGKTLTSECYSEKTGRPLYSVQCSQLGMDFDSLEKNLARVLRNAARWNAVLSMDEADVYLTARGEDLEQNAIVGVFLRLLEYYSGILFLTTNRTSKIDDAIISRCAALIRYKNPDEQSRVRIWRIIAKQYGLEIDDATLKVVSKKYDLSGRGIKQLVRLVKRYTVVNKEKMTVSICDKMLLFYETSIEK